MKNFFILMILGTFIVACESDNVFENNSGTNQNQIINEYVSIKNGVMKFKDISSFQEVTTLLNIDSEYENNFKKQLEKLNFRNLDNYYSNITESMLNPIFKTKTIPENFKKYFKLEKSKDDLVLVYAVPERFLRTILSEDFSFTIGNDLFRIEGSDLKIYKDSQVAEVIKINRGTLSKSSKVNSLLSTSNTKDYTWDGSDYRIFFNVTTSSTASNYFNTVGYQFVTLWNTVDAQLLHKKKTLGLYWNKDAQKLTISGTSVYDANQTNYGNNGYSTYYVNAYSQTIFNEVVNIHTLSRGIFRVKSYSLTGKCKGNNGIDYTIALSETL